MKTQTFSRNFTLFMVALFCFIGRANAQLQFVNSYNAVNEVTHIKSTKIIETHDHYYVSIAYGVSVSTGYNAMVINKYDLNGTVIFTKIYDLGGTASNPTDLFPYGIAESQDPTDYGFAIVGRYYDNGAGNSGQFALKTDANGNMSWFNQWVGVEARGVVFNVTAAGTYNVIVAGTVINGITLVNNPQITQFSSSTGAYTGVSYIYNNKTPLMTVDMVNLTSTSNYCILLNDNYAVGNFRPAYLQIDYGFTTASMNSITGTWHVAPPVAFVKDETTSSVPFLYILNQTRVTSVGVRPSIYKVNLSTNTVSANYYTSPAYGTADNVIPTGITFMHYSTGELMVTGNHSSGSITNEPVVFTTDLSLAVVGNLNIHLGATAIPTTSYNQLTSTFNTNYYMVTGNVSNLLTLSKVKYDGTVSCNGTKTWTATSITTSVTTNGSLSGFNLSIANPSPVVTGPTWHELIVCGCTQLHPKTYYSRIINDNFVTPTFDFLQADYDYANDNVLVPATRISGAGSHDPFISNVQLNSSINWSRIYPITGSDEAMAVKVASNGDIITAGYTVDAAGNHSIFVTRRTPADVQVFHQIYYQNNTDVTGFIFLTETKISKDIVVAGCTLGPNDNNIIIRLSATGGTYYYDDHGVYANGNADERYPWIFGITPTSDDGFVLLGNTGHQWDFFAATVMKFDQNFNTSFTHAMNWSYIYRHQLAAYSLWVAGERSSTYARAAIEDPNTLDIVVVGSQADNDQYGTSITYQNGFVLELSSAGAYVNLANYAPNTTADWINFNGINMAGSDYIITGSSNHSGGGTQTLMTYIASGSLAPSWAQLYGTGSVNVGWSVFATPNGYMSVGYSNDNGAPEQPNVLSVDASGKLGSCNIPYTLNQITDVNDPPVFNIGPSFATQQTQYTPTPDYPCEVMVDECASSTAPVVLHSGVGATITANTAVKCYPNPTSGELNIELSTEKASNGKISIIDMQGKEIISRPIGFNQGVSNFKLDMSEMKAGLYLVKVTDDKNGTTYMNKIQKF